MSFVEVCKSKLDAFCDDLEASSPMFLAAAAGELQPQQLANLLISTHVLISNTPGFMTAAIEKIDANRYASMLAYYRGVKRDEDGHHKWSERDIANVSNKYGVTTPRVSKHVPEFVKYQYDLIDTNPILHLGHIICTEYFVARSGQRFADNLLTKCSYPKDCISVIYNHAMLDPQHAAESLEAAEGLERDHPADVNHVVGQMQHSMDFYKRYFQDVMH